MKYTSTAFALALGLGIAPALAEEVTHFTLDNGMEAVVIEDHRAPVVVQMVWYRAGAADEMRGKSGIAHYLEHLMFKGTDEMAPGEFSKTVTANGGSDNAFTSYDYTAYYQRIASDRLELVMKMEADRMRDLVRNNPMAAQAVQVLVKGPIGPLVTLPLLAGLCWLRRDLAGVERLGEETQPRAIPEHQLQSIGTPRTEHADRARERILAQRRLHQRRVALQVGHDRAQVGCRQHQGHHVPVAHERQALARHQGKGRITRVRHRGHHHVIQATGGQPIPVLVDVIDRGVATTLQNRLRTMAFHLQGVSQDLQVHRRDSLAHGTAWM